jgi:membrane-associated phospholipid phosphatase
MSPTDPFWNFVVDFGDLGALGPAVMAGCGVLCARGRWRPALVWAASFAGCILAVAAFKAGRALAPDPLGLCEAAPSGHTAMSFAFYGVLSAFLFQAIGGWRGAAAALSTTILGAMVAAATILLRWHPWIDVVEGMALGSASAAPSWRMVRQLHPADGFWTTVGACFVVVALHGVRLDTPFEGAMACEPKAGAATAQATIYSEADRRIFTRLALRDHPHPKRQGHSQSWPKFWRSFSTAEPHA